MSSHENTSTFQESQKLPITQEIFSNSSILNKIPEEQEENNKLIRPIPINIKVIKKPKSELTTMQDSSLTIKNVVKELKMPIMYNNYNYVNFAKNEIYLGQLNHLNEFKDKRKEININDFSFRKDKPCCSCTKTKCIKKYCECFANSKYCVDCLCQNCMNKLEEIEQFQNNNTTNIIENENQNDKNTCTCTKSNCCKKYCECFKINKKCTSKCRCLNCLNMDSQYANILNNNNNLINDVIIKNNINSEESNNNILLNKSSELENFNDNFAIQRISVLINKFQTEINVEKISKEELNLLCKKRKHN